MREGDGINIYFDINKFKDIANRMNRLQQRINRIKNEYVGITGQIDMEITSWEDLYYSLRRVERDLENIHSAAFRNYHYLEECLNEYSNTDRSIGKLALNLPLIPSGRGSIINNRGKDVIGHKVNIKDLSMEPIKSPLPDVLQFSKSNIKTGDIKNNLIVHRILTLGLEEPKEPELFSRDGAKYAETIASLDKKDYKSNKEYISTVMKAMQIHNIEERAIEGKNGWFCVSREEAQEMANEGFPTIIINESLKGDKWMIVKPLDNDENYDSMKGPKISYIKDSCVISDFLYKTHTKNEDHMFYAHA